jgi:tetratricopeptide (TPR) repeat protein
MVEVLIQRSKEIDGSSPLDALLLTEIAFGIADGLSVIAYPYDHVVKIRGRALREQAYMLSVVGRLPEARRTAEAAAQYLKQIPVPPPELAKLDLVRSNIARQQEKFDDAVAFARSAAESFEWFGDRDGWLRAQTYEAAARLTAGDYRQALDIWRSMEPYVPEMTEADRARRLHNMALCAGEQGEFGEAAQAYARAAELFAAAGDVVGGVKCRRAAAHSLFCSGKVAEAIPLLTSVRAELEQLGMEIDAALAALQLAEGFLIVGRTDKVPDIARTLIERFTRAGILGSAMTALAFLREAVATGHATPSLVNHVQEFIRTIPVVGQRHFEPPPAQPRGES